jgi:hypothetical protein
VPKIVPTKVLDPGSLERRIPGLRAHLHDMPITRWLDYADPQLARICRSSTGSKMPITRWLENADR